MDTTTALGAKLLRAVTARAVVGPPRGVVTAVTAVVVGAIKPSAVVVGAVAVGVVRGTARLLRPEVRLD